jgi:hypothetical protein
MINTSNKTLEDLLKTQKIKQKFKAQGGTKPDIKNMKKQKERGQTKRQTIQWLKLRSILAPSELQTKTTCSVKLNNQTTLLFIEE